MSRFSSSLCSLSRHSSLLSLSPSISLPSLLFPFFRSRSLSLSLSSTFFSLSFYFPLYLSPFFPSRTATQHNKASQLPVTSQKDQKRITYHLQQQFPFHSFFLLIAHGFIWLESYTIHFYSNRLFQFLLFFSSPTNHTTDSAILKFIFIKITNLAHLTHTHAHTRNCPSPRISMLCYTHPSLVSSCLVCHIDYDSLRNNNNNNALPTRFRFFLFCLFSSHSSSSFRL